MSRMSDAEIELARAEDGDECPVCHAGTVERVVSARVYLATCAACDSITRSQNPPQTDEDIRRRWGRGTYTEEERAKMVRPMSHAPREQEAYEVPSWAIPKK